MIRLAARREAFVTSTLAVLAMFGPGNESAALAADPRIAPYLTGEQRQGLNLRIHGEGQNPRLLEMGLRNIRALHDAGVDIVAGTDSQSSGRLALDASMFTELELLVRAGLRPTAALACATSVLARRFGLSGRGQIRAGSRADLVLVKGDPTTDITALRDIAAVWKNGHPITRELS